MWEKKKALHTVILPFSFVPILIALRMEAIGATFSILHIKTNGMLSSTLEDADPGKADKPEATPPGEESVALMRGEEGNGDMRPDVEGKCIPIPGKIRNNFL